MKSARLWAFTLVILSCGGREHGEIPAASQASDAGSDLAFALRDAFEADENPRGDSKGETPDDGYPDVYASGSRDGSNDGSGDGELAGSLDGTGLEYPDGASDAGSDVGVPSRVFGSTCESNDQCRLIGTAFFCLKVFQNASIQGGFCTQSCSLSGSICGPSGFCVSETSDVGHDPISACLLTCKSDLPCRTGFMCLFTYKDNMLVEPSVCAPDGIN
jgi:hypothetical protein